MAFSSRRATGAESAVHRVRRRARRRPASRTQGSIRQRRPRLLPPAGSFAGDKINLTVTYAGDSLHFTASGPNTGTTQTELLLQKLKTAHRAPTDKYVSQAFVTYNVHSLMAMLEVASGIYIPAYRFVNPATGQMTNLQVLPEIIVP